jgi:outer membrane PBP1 activator LpoA protein
MSWWTKTRDAWETVTSLGTYNPSQQRAQKQMINAQVQAYKDQTEIAKEQLAQSQAATDAEKKRVQEKQIRSLRNTYRASSAGLLNVGSGDNEMSSQLGG